MKKMMVIMVSLLLVSMLLAQTAWAGESARMPAIDAGASRLIQLQRTETGWEGTWYWYVGSTYNATNLTGVTALGLLEAYQDTKDDAYLDAAIAAADFIKAHLGAGATGAKYNVRTTAPDIVFLFRLAQVTGDTSYADRATLEWDNIKISYPTASALDTLFRTLNRRSAWDLAFFLEAAYLAGDNVWADGAAAILSNTTDVFYYGTDTWWYALNVSAAVRGLVGCGYAGVYNYSIVQLMSWLVGLVDSENGVGGYVQDTAYVVLGLKAVGGATQGYANALSRWLAGKQSADGGWVEPDTLEYPEVDGEAVRAMAASIGNNVTLSKLKAPGRINSSWLRVTRGQGALPFNGD